MDTPRLVSSTLGDEEPFARVSLGGEDLLLVTPTRTVVYRSDGLLRDESIESYPHDCDRLVLSKRRRKATLRFEYIDGPREFSVPKDRVDAVLGPILRGVLVVGDVIDEAESVEGVYRFSELTLVITSDRLVKHVGGALWDHDHETFAYENLTGLEFVDGRLATEITVEVDGRPDRIKAPAESARYVRRDLEGAVLDYHDVSSLEELDAKVGREDDRPSAAEAFATDDLEGLVPNASSRGRSRDRDESRAESEEPEPGTQVGEETISEPEADGATDDGGLSLDSVSEDDRTAAVTRATEPASRTASTAEDETGSETMAERPTTGERSSTDTVDDAVDGDSLAAEVAALAERVDAQSEQLERQSELIEQLIEELRRGR